MAPPAIADSLGSNPPDTRGTPARDAAPAAAAELRRSAPANPSGQPVLDLIFLGMGRGWAVASLFPEAPPEPLIRQRFTKR